MDYNQRKTHKRPRSPSHSSFEPGVNLESELKAGGQQYGANTRNRVLDEKEKHEIERKNRMARLRAENEEEEKKLAKVDEASKIRSEGGEYDDTEMLSFSTGKKKAPGKERIIKVDREELEELDEEDQMLNIFGFGGFDSTKGKAVEDNQTSASKGLVAKNKARKYRQYMNRKGGFNRPLDKMN